MSEQVLDGLRIAILTADGFEQVEVTRPMEALRRAGADVEIVSLHPGSIQGMNMLAPGKKLDVDRTVMNADSARYHGLHIPGGFIAPDYVRQSDRALDFVSAFEEAGKPISTICHGPWVLISAGLVRKRRVASWPGIRDDIRNAGGEWVDDAVVHDANWVSSRSPKDLPRFDRAIVDHFAAFAGREAQHGLRTMGFGRLLFGAGALAATAYAARRGRRRDSEEDGDAWTAPRDEGTGRPREFAKM